MARYVGQVTHEAGHAVLVFAMGHWEASTVVLLPLLLVALAADCPGKENTNLPWSGTPALLQKVANGSLFTAGDGEDQLYGEDDHTLLCKNFNIRSHMTA